jgi:hypothetical protein
LEETSVNDTRAVSNPTKTRKRNGNTRNQDKGEEKKRRGKKELQLRERERESSNHELVQIVRGHDPPPQHCGPAP